MGAIYPKAFINGNIVPFEEAGLSIASSAVLYGLSVYTVFHISKSDSGRLAFRLPEHYERLVNSARIIGIDGFESSWNYEKLVKTLQETLGANDIDKDVFIRVSIHVDSLLAGTRSRGLSSNLSIFIYDAVPIVPPNGARLKTSVWRRIPDYAIPSRAKVNGAYVNSVLAKQDALDSGYDDCIFLDSSGHVCELSASNIFLVRDGHVITPDTNSDLLEGISRRSIMKIATNKGYKVVERPVDLTELYVAEEVFVSGTSAFLTPVIEVDARSVGGGKIGPVTKDLQTTYKEALYGTSTEYKSWVTSL